jgi:hypothetical protein
VGKNNLRSPSEYICNCPWFWQHAWWVFAAAALLIAVRPALLKYNAMRFFLLGVLTGAGAEVFAELYVHSNARVALDQLIAALITYGASLYAGLCGAVQRGLGKRLTEWRGDKWAKELDYPYLFGGGLGLVISMNRLDTVSDHLAGIEIVGPLIVTTAIVIRLVKTRVEIAGWNRKEFYNSPTVPP